MLIAIERIVSDALQDYAKGKPDKMASENLLYALCRISVEIHDIELNEGQRVLAASELIRDVKSDRREAMCLAERMLV